MTDTRTVVGEVFRLLADWDAEGVSKLFAEEIDWYVPTAPALPWGGTRTHRSEVQEFFQTMWAHFDTDQSELGLEQILMDGEDAVALGTFSHVANSTGERFTTPVALHMRVVDGQVTRLYLYEDTYAVAKAFGIIKDVQPAAS
jgi:ketosteroid isomerase-like protein